MSGVSLSETKRVSEGCAARTRGVLLKWLRETRLPLMRDGCRDGAKQLRLVSNAEITRRPETSVFAGDFKWSAR